MTDYKIKYDYSVFGSLECINMYLRVQIPDCAGLRFQGEGWYRGTSNDTLLIVPEGDQWRLLGWRNHDPRPVYQRLLTLENHNV